MLVLINITMHWWYREQRPFPRSATIADRIGVDARTVQRSIRKIQDLKLVEREIETLEDGTSRSVLNLSPLVKRLSGFARRDRNYVARMQRKEVG
jgi:predicted transcriptional regulator